MFSQPNVVANGNLIKSEYPGIRSAVLLIKLTKSVLHCSRSAMLLKVLKSVYIFIYFHGINPVNTDSLISSAVCHDLVSFLPKYPFFFLNSC